MFQKYLKDFILAVLGGLSISLGTLASKMCPYPALAPLLFAVGILMVMAFDWHLITRHIPTKDLSDLWTVLIVIVGNLLSAFLLGLFFDIPLVVPDNLFLMSIAGGAVIGLVSFNNLKHSPYTVPIAALLMYIFVMLGLPHCVVYAFLGASFETLLIVLLGNIVGGLALRGAMTLCNFLKS